MLHVSIIIILLLLLYIIIIYMRILELQYRKKRRRDILGYNWRNHIRSLSKDALNSNVIIFDLLIACYQSKFISLLAFFL